MSNKNGEIILAKQVAITEAHEDGAEGRAYYLEALKIESELLKDLDHTNVIEYLGFEQTPDAITM